MKKSFSIANRNTGRLQKQPRWWTWLLCAAILWITVEAGAQATFRYFRFTPTQLRDASANSVQLAEIEVYLGQTNLAGATASNPGGSSPSSESPPQAVDGNLATKWLDFNKGALVLDFRKPVVADGFRWATANDAQSRDPIRWRFEGSLDQANWMILHDQTAADFATPDARLTFLPRFGFDQLPKLPVIRKFVAQAGGLTVDQAVAVTRGTPVILRWEVFGATSLSLQPGAITLAPGTNELSLTPERTTSFALVARNDAGVVSAALTILVDRPSPKVWINEIMAVAQAGDSALRDEDGDTVDWIEIFNPQTSPVDLGGYYLTDQATNRTSWRFPSGAMIAPVSNLIVFASGKDRAIPGRPLHTSFKLSGEGEYLGLIGPDGRTPIHEMAPQFPQQFANISFGLTNAANLNGFEYFTVPTPGRGNAIPSGLPLVQRVVFSRESGTFIGPWTLHLSTDVSKAEIRFTIDGSIPTAQAPIYTGPVTVSRSMQVRACLFRPGELPGSVTSRTYVKLGTDVTAFTSDLPVMILENYVGGPIPSGSNLQEHFLLAFEPDATGRSRLTASPAAAHRAGLHRRGSSTSGDPKGSYRVEFWDENDEDEEVGLLGLPADPDWILTAPYRFDRSLVRVSFLHQLSSDIGQYAPRSVFVELFLNTDATQLTMAHYAGVYVLQERIGRGSDRVDVEKLEPTDVVLPDVSGGYILSIDRSDSPAESFRTTRGTPTLPPHGTPRPWFNFIYPKVDDLAAPQSDYIRSWLDSFETVFYGPQSFDPRQGYASFLDVESFVDHHILRVLAKDPDALRLSTYLHKARGGKLRMGPIWDTDRTMGCDGDGRSADPVGWDPTPENAGFFTYDWWGRLFEDPDFWQRWIDRWQSLRLGELSPAEIGARVDDLAAQVKESQARNFQRWPEVRPNGGAFSPLSGWEGEVDHFKSWLTRRAAWIDSQFPAPPRFSAGSGVVRPGTLVTITTSGDKIQYTLDGSDPRLPGGGVAPRAAGGLSSVQLSFTGSVTVTARAFNGLRWSAPVRQDFVLGVVPNATNLVVSEIHYHPASPSVAEIGAGFDQRKDFEFLELLNIGDSQLDLRGLELVDGVTFRFDAEAGAGLTLNSGERVVLVSNLDAFRMRYADRLPGVRIAGQYSGSLSDDGETIALRSVAGAVVRSFTYGDGAPWPEEADGGGFSLVWIGPNRQPSPNPNDPVNWRISVQPGGSPGTTDTTRFAGDPGKDANGNGRPDFLDYAQGNPSLPWVGLPLEAGFESVETTTLTETYLVISFPRNLAADDAEFRLETSTDLRAWNLGQNPLVFLRSRSLGNGFAKISYRSERPARLLSTQFIRLIVAPR